MAGCTADEQWVARAHQAWEQLLANSLRRRRGHVQVLEGPGRRHGTAALWPFSQVLAAALAMAELPGPSTGEQRHAERTARLIDALRVELDRYRSGDAYATHPGSPERYHDDNAWIGLDALVALQGATGVLMVGDDDRPDAVAARWSPVLRRSLSFVLAGQHADGGIHWVEARRDRSSPCNACSTAPGIALALRSLRALPDLRPEEGAAVAAAAGRADAWLWSTLRSPEGLLWDHQAPDGRIEPTIWSYNQGMAVGADVAWWQLTGDEARLVRARATATAALAWFAKEDRMWRQPPAFVAILFRELVALHEVSPRADVLPVLDGYVRRLWDAGRDRTTGRFTDGGIGTYGDGGTLDHAGAVQLLALRARLG